MKDKVVVITGGTSELAKSLRKTLAQVGARIVLVARNKSRADETLARLRRSGPDVGHSVYFADLSRLAEMKRLAAEIVDREPRIDILINNAGALFGTRRLTEDGLEYTFALNHMSYFVVTEGLRERLLASGGARIIQHSLRSSSRAPLWISTIFSPQRLRSHDGLWSLKALQYPIYPSTCSEPAGH